MDHCWDHFKVSVTDVCLVCHFMATHHPQHPIEIACGIGEKLSKMAGNSARYPLSSW